GRQPTTDPASVHVRESGPWRSPARTRTPWEELCGPGPRRPSPRGASEHLVAEVGGLEEVAAPGQLLALALQHHLAVVHHVGPIGHRERHVDVLLDEEHARAGL